MQQSGVYDLLKMLEISLEEGFPIIPRKFTVVKTKEIETLIDNASVEKFEDAYTNIDFEF